MKKRVLLILGLIVLFSASASSVFAFIDVTVAENGDYTQPSGFGYDRAHMFLNGELLFPQYLTAFNGYPDANVIYDFTVSPTSVAELGDTLSLCFTGDVIISSMEECETHGFNVTYDTLTTVVPISNSSTRIVLSLPERNATTTENPIFFWKYYVNNETASTSQYVMQKISIRPIKRNFWGSVTTGDPYQIIEREAELRDFYVSENETLTFPDGIYEWQGELQTHRDRECSFYDCFIQILANTNSGTTTIATSEKRLFVVGNGGLFATSTDQGNTTSNPFTWCSEYDGDGSITSQIVVAVCLIPNAISFAVDLVFIPDPSDLALDQSLLEQNFKNTLKTVPIGYFSRFYDILVGNATSTATSTLLTVNFTVPTSTPFLGGVDFHFNPWAGFYQSGSFIQQAKSAGSNPKDVWQIFQPYIDGFLILILIFAIINDLIPFAHHQREEQSNHDHSGIKQK